MAAPKPHQLTLADLRVQIIENAEFLYPESRNLKLITAGEPGKYIAILFQNGYLSGFVMLKKSVKASSPEAAFEALLDTLQREIKDVIGDREADLDVVKTENTEEKADNDE